MQRRRERGWKGFVFYLLNFIKMTTPHNRMLRFVLKKILCTKIILK